MATDIELSQSASGGSKQERDRKTRILPEYLRLVARKSRAGFDKVHDELTKIYSSEKKMQRRNTQASNFRQIPSPNETKSQKSPTSPTQSVRNSSMRNQKDTKESKRKQWARSSKTNTMWMSTGSILPTTSTFISYIEELEDEEPSVGRATKQRTDVEILKKELNLTRQHSDLTGLAKGNENLRKSLSANLVRKDKTMFSFDEPRVTEPVKCADETIDNTSDESKDDPDLGPDYVNVGDVAKYSPTDYDVPLGSAESNYDVPKFALKPPIKPRIHTKPTDKTTTNLKQDTVTQSNPVNNNNNQDSSMLQTSKRNTADEDYLQMDEVIKNGDTNGNIDAVIVKTDETTDDGLGESGDYVLPDLCPNKTKDLSYTQLEENNDENIYATIQKVSKVSDENGVKEEVIYANSSSVVYDDFDMLRENELFSGNDEDIYQVPPTHFSPSADKDQTFDLSVDYDSAEKEFYDFSVQEVVKCLDACALPHLAAVCKEEQLDGRFFRNFDESQLIKEPFLLNWFHLAKLRRVISGWRPKS